MIFALLGLCFGVALLLLFVNLMWGVPTCSRCGCLVKWWHRKRMIGDRYRYFDYHRHCYVAYHRGCTLGDNTDIDTWTP